MLRAILLGLVLLQPLGANARGDKLQEAIAAFEQRGFVIRRREVVVCPRGNQLETLLHEGWHAVQSLCLREKPLLGLDTLLPRLGRRDRLELQVLYRPERWQRDAEARVMAREPLDRYQQTLDRSCTAAVPEAPKAN